MAPEHLVDFARYVRDDLGYELLSNVTGVDYLGREGDRFEVVYHAYSMSQPEKTGFGFQGPSLRRKPRTPLALWASGKPAIFRNEKFNDLYGINFTGHPQYETHFVVGTIFTATQCVRITKKPIMRTR